MDTQSQNLNPNFALRYWNRLTPGWRIIILYAATFATGLLATLCLLSNGGTREVAYKAF